MAGHQFLVDLVHSVFTSVPLQLFATVVTLVTLSAIGVAVRAVGAPLKSHLDDALVESIQAGFLAVVTARSVASSSPSGGRATCWRRASSRSIPVPRPSSPRC